MGKKIKKEKLGRRVTRAGFWVFFLRIMEKVFGIVRLIIIARFISPNNFGLMGIALLTMSTLNTFSQTGFQQALIQKKGRIKKYLDSTWTFLIFRGIILFLILYFLAPYAATFFAAPEARLIIRVIALATLFSGFNNVGIIFFQKKLEFNKHFFYKLSGTLADFVVAVALAIILKNVWALVFGLLAGNFVRLIASYLLHPYRPKISFDFKNIAPLFHFGKWILGSSILIFLITQGDDIFLGKMLGVTALGFYQMAYKISNMPATEYSHLIATVMLPAYSKIQNNLLKLKEAYLQVLQLTTFLAVPIAGGIFVLAPEFVRIFLSGKWMPIVPVMQVLAIYGLLRAIGATTGVVFVSQGKPELRTKIQFVALIILAILIYPLTQRFGMVGTAMAVLIYVLITNPYAVYLVLRIIMVDKFDYDRLSKIITFPLIGTLIMMAVVFVLKKNIDLLGIHLNLSILYFVLIMMIGIITYLALAYLFDRFSNYKIWHLAREQLKSLFGKKEEI